MTAATATRTVTARRPTSVSFKAIKVGAAPSANVVALKRLAVWAAIAACGSLAVVYVVAPLAGLLARI